MSKKEIRVSFNLDNTKERELYEFLSNKTSASGYLKDLAIEFLDGNGRWQKDNNNFFNDSDSLNGVATILKEINTTLSNIKIVSMPNNNEDSQDDEVNQGEQNIQGNQDDLSDLKNGLESSDDFWD